MVMLLIAGFGFLIPLLSRPLLAKPQPRMHGLRGVHSNSRAGHHQQLQQDGDPFSPCAE